MTALSTSERRRLQGVRQIVFFNWPLYLLTTLVMAGVALLAATGPQALRLPLVGAVVVAAAVLALTLAASWWIYDYSALYQWTWLHPLLPPDLADYLVVTAGFDEISHDLAVQFPAATQVVADVLDPAGPVTGSIRRARRRSPSLALPCLPAHLPVPDASQDTVFAVFAAHELRNRADREALFRECARVLRPQGRVLLVEHLRDLPNIAIFGPGAWHFYPKVEWLRCAAPAGFTVSAQRTMTPFVHALVFAR